MSQTIVRARVRPARVAVLINREATQDDFVLAVRFLSRLWGGMFAPILPANPSPPDVLTEFRLSEARPDYVYSIGLNADRWMPRIQDACQPRGYRPLVAEFLQELYGFHKEQHITDRQLLNYFYRRSDAARPLRVTHLIPWDEESNLFAHAAALFGIHYKLDKNPFIPVELGGNWGDHRDPGSLITAHATLVQNNEMCWAELASHGLNLHFGSGHSGSPTIVLVENIVEDLSLFWNLRMRGNEWTHRWIIPLPASMPRDESHATMLRDWILGFLKYQQRPNYVFITSQLD